MKRYLPILLFFSAIILCPIGSSAKDIILYDSTYNIRTSGDYSEFYEDVSGEMRFDDALKKYNSGEFKPLGIDLPKNEKNESNYWIRFSIRNQSKSDRNWLLEFPDSRINDLEIFISNGSKEFKRIEQGNLKPFGDKLYNHKNFHIKLPFKDSETIVIYAKFHSKFEVGIASIVRDTDEFISYALSEYFILGLFYGLILLMAVYNLFMYLMLKEITYLYYVFYAISVGFFLMTLDGTGFQFIWPNSPGFNNYSNLVFSCSMVIFALHFTRSFLKTKRKQPLMNKVLLATVVLRISLFILALIIHLDRMFFYYLDASILATAYITSILAYKAGNKASKFLVLAYSLLFAGYLITALKEIRLVPNNVFTVYAFNFGVILEIAFLSLAMADRLRFEIFEKENAKDEKIKELKKNEELQQELLVQMEEREVERERINKELEDKVSARTQELKIANDKLKEQAVEINRMNIQLDHDNRKLQKNLTSAEKARVTNEEVNYQNFLLVYPDDYSCMEYLSELKWQNGFVCKKCSNDSYGKGKEVFARRCKKCGYNESVTAYTLFHKLKFPLKKAYYLLFLVTSNENKYTVDELSNELDLRRNTCWSFKKKIEEKVVSNKRSGKRHNSWEHLILNE